MVHSQCATRRFMAVVVMGEVDDLLTDNYMVLFEKVE